MKKRVISAVIFIALWVIILLVNNPIFDTAIVVMLSIIATYEYFKAFKNIGYNPISWIGYLGCLSLFLTGGFFSIIFWDAIFCKYLFARTVLIPSSIIRSASAPNASFP